MNPVDFKKLVMEYAQLFQKDFKSVMRIKGISVEESEATPVNRICVVNADSGSCTI